jgi:hypothetical protein
MLWMGVYPKPFLERAEVSLTELIETVERKSAATFAAAGLDARWAVAAGGDAAAARTRAAGAAVTTNPSDCVADACRSFVPAHYGLVLLPEIVLSVWAMFMLLLDVFQKGSRSEPSSPDHAVADAGRLLGWPPWRTAGCTGCRRPAPAGMIAVDGFRIFANFVFLLAARCSC